MESRDVARRKLALFKELDILIPKIRELIAETDQKIREFIADVLESDSAEPVPMSERHVSWINDPDSITYRSAKFLKGLSHCKAISLSKDDLKEAFGSTQVAGNALLVMANYDLIRMEFNEHSDLYEIEESTNILSNLPILKMCSALNQAFAWPCPDSEDLPEAKMRFLEAAAKDMC